VNKKRKTLSKRLQKYKSLLTYKFKLEVRRRMGRPRQRWKEDVIKDHRVRKGKQNAVNR
jgi:hypothetical protein